MLACITDWPRLQDPWNYEQSAPSAPFLRGAEKIFLWLFCKDLVIGLSTWLFKPRCCSPLKYHGTEYSARPQNFKQKNEHAVGSIYLPYSSTSHSPTNSEYEYRSGSLPPVKVKPANSLSTGPRPHTPVYHHILFIRIFRQEDTGSRMYSNTDPRCSKSSSENKGKECMLKYDTRTYIPRTFSLGLYNGVSLDGIRTIVESRSCRDR